MNNGLQDAIKNFVQVFAISAEKALLQGLDVDTCKKISYEITSVEEISDAESQKDGNAIFRLEYATGNRQGHIVVLIPEELIAVISDTLTGGNGKDAYKGSLSELEINSILGVFEKIFKEIEDGFKKQYESNFAFGANPQLFLKEMPEYSLNTNNTNYDLMLVNTVTLNEGQEYHIKTLSNLSNLGKLMDDLGLSKTGAPKKASLSSMNISCLADVKIRVTAELGKSRVPIKYALELDRGSVVELDTLNNADIKVYANGVEFAYAQIVAIEDNFGLRITKIIPKEERMECI